MDPSYYSLAIGIWAIYNSINDPLFGWIMDRFPTRWGRRVPWMIIFMLPLCISFGLIWTPPHFEDKRLTFLWLVAMLLVFDTGYTMVILAWAALFPEIFETLRDRSIVSALRQVFSIIALVVALVVAPGFVKDGDIGSYGKFGWALAIISIVNIVFALFGCQEKQQTDLTQESYSLKDGLNLLRTNKNFLVFLVINMIAYYAYGQILSMFPFYRKFILEQSEKLEINVYSAVLGMTVLSLPFWVWITNKTNPKTTFIFSSIAFAVSLLPLFVFSPDDPIVLVMAFVGFGLAGLLIVVDLMLAEIVDEDYSKHGIRREGIFFGINGFFIRLAILMQAFTFSSVSKWSGFNQNLAQQTEKGKLGIKIQMLMFPIVFLIVSIVLIYKFYHISQKRNKYNSFDE